MAFCTECGANVPDNVNFCTGCGKPVGAAQKPAPPSYNPSYAMGSGNTPPPLGSPYAVVGTGWYFGMTLLFALPVVGWIVCIIMAFVSQNINKRNFARSFMIFLIIGVVLGTICYFLFQWVWSALGALFSDYSEGFNIFDVYWY